jgi:hypothetical protein
MTIVIGPGITIGGGISVIDSDLEVNFIAAEDNDPLITENDLNLITEN